MKRQLAQLSAWAKEELEAERRLLALLEAQEAAVRAGKTEDVRESGEALARELPDGASRERRRARVIGELARALGVQASVLTLSSIVRRAEAAGEDVATLSRLRDELRSCVAAVVRTGRRIATLARYHQEVLEDLLRILSSSHEASADLGDRALREGALVDAEG